MIKSGILRSNIIRVETARVWFDSLGSAQDPLETNLMQKSHELSISFQYGQTICCCGHKSIDALSMGGSNHILKCSLHCLSFEHEILSNALFMAASHDAGLPPVAFLHLNTSLTRALKMISMLQYLLSVSVSLVYQVCIYDHMSL